MLLISLVFICAFVRGTLELPKDPNTCEDGDRTFYHGEEFRSAPMLLPCMQCTCTEDWTGDVFTDSHCERRKCEEDTVERGCVPIFYGDNCCPLSSYCGDNLPNSSIPLATEEEIESGNTCVFLDRHYSLGQELDLPRGKEDYATVCVKCKCLHMLPVFTCQRLPDEECNKPQ